MNNKGRSLVPLVILIGVFVLTALGIAARDGSLSVEENKESTPLRETRVTSSSYFNAQAIHFTTNEGVDCIALIGVKKAGLSCNWVKYNN